MKKVKLFSSILAANILLSSLAVNSFAGELPVIETSDGETSSSIDNVKVSVICTDITDTSLTISWNSVPNAESYSIICNNSIVAEGITDGRYEISDLKPGSEFFVSVHAFDDTGNLISESEEKTLHTNLTVDSDMKLTENLTVNSLRVIAGTLNLNGYSLTVENDTYITDSYAYVEIGSGSLYINGNLNFENESGERSNVGGLRMTNSKGSVCVRGDINLLSVCSGSLSAGTLELCGDFNSNLTGNWDSFNTSSSHKLVLSGRDTQTLTLPSNSKLSIVEVKNFSDGGVIFTNQISISDLRDNGCKVSVTSDENTIGWTLNKDETFDGSMSLVAGTLDLNGHKLTITGDLLQSGGTVLVNGGVLEVQGDYRLQSSNGVNNGILNMTNDADIVRVSGDFVMQSNQSHDGKLSAGILEIGGDFVQGGNYYNFHTTENHTVLLNGTQAQSIDIVYNSLNYSRIINLKIENTSDDGVTFLRKAYVLGDLYNTSSLISESSNICIVSSTKFADKEWNYDVTVGESLTLSDITIDGTLYSEYRETITLGGDVHVKGTFFMYSNVNLNGYTLNVDGNVWVDSELNLNRGRLNVGGNFNISSTSFTSSYGYITMKYSTDYIYVDGNMLFYSNNNYSTLTNGTIEIKGDFTQKFNAQENNFYASGNHRVILSGNSLQKVHFDSSKSKLNFLEIRNTSEAGVELFSKVQVGKIVSNDCNISYYDPEIVGRTLDGDKVVDGDLTIDEDTLDLNGHTLIVTGNLIHSGGTIYINNGTLEVKGDYRIQTADGSSSKGKLLMTSESDIVKVAGDFVMQSTVSHKNCLTNGILEIGGDFSRVGGAADNFSTSGNHTVILNGTAAQMVNFESASNSALTNLKIDNSSTDGVTFARNIYVAGILYNTESVLNKSEKINALSTAVLENNEWNHSITFSQPGTLSDNLKIKGDVYFYGTVSLPSNSKYAISEAAFSKYSSDSYTFSVGGSIYTYGDLLVNGGSIFVGEDLYVGMLGRESGIKMDNDSDYILVNGNIYYQRGYEFDCELSNGTIELKGDFTQKGSFYKEKDASKNFCLLLSGSGLQTISTEDSDFSFGTIDVDNHSEEGVYFASTVDYVELRKNGCNVKFRYEGTKGWTLLEDEFFEGDLTIASGILDLNGHRLTITGNLIQPSGTVWINGGELIVEGDYRIQTDSENEIVASSGALKMTNESDVVRVSGSFVMQSNKDHYENTMSAGILEIGGDLIVPSGGHYNNFRCSGDHTVVLNGTKKQNVYIDYSATYSNEYFYRYDGSRINNLKIVNTSDEGVNFNGITLIVGELYNMSSRISNSRNIYAVSSTVFADNMWDGDISFPLGILVTNPLFIKGDVYSYGSLTVNPCDSYGQDILGIKDIDSGEYSLIVDGNVYAYDMLNLPYHSSMIVSGDISIDKVSSNYYGGCISLNSDSKLFVGGTLRSSSNRSSSLRSGTLEIRGDLLFFNAENGLTASDDHTTIFSGEKRQTIYIDNTSSVFDIVEIKNYSDEGVCFETPVLYTELIDNGCKITQGSEAVSGWTLTDDETVDGNLNLANGVLDLNGYRLTVNGDLIQSGGTVFVNGGELCVLGDYRIQSKRGDVYNNSLGILKMTNEADIVRVFGSFVMQSTESHNGCLSAGTLEIGGDFNQVGGYSNNFPTSGLHTIVLNGTAKQNINFNNSSCSITNLIIRNTSSEGIEFVNTTYVTGKLHDTSSKILNGKNLCVTETTDFADNAWSADITFSKTPVLLPDFYIGGSLYLNSDLVLVGDMVIAGSLYANSDINVNGYTLEIGKDLQLDSMLYVNGSKVYIGNMLDISRSYGASSGYLYMHKADDYVLVNGSVYIYSTQNTYFTNGTLEIKGDFTQKNYGSQTKAGFSGKVILSGNEVQRISVENTGFTFKTLEITKPIDTGYVFSRTPMWNTLIENITDTEAPSAPSKLSFIDSTSTSIRIKWVGSKDNISDCSYDIYRDGKRIATVNDTEYIDNALIPYTEYTYYIIAHDVSGNASEPSNTLTARTNSDMSGLLQPTNLNFKIRSDGSVYLSWTSPANSDNTVIYNIYRNGAVIGSTGSTSYIDRNAEQGYHEYYVEAVDENSSAASDSVLVDNMPPAAPMISVGEIGDKRVVLNWTCEDNVGIDHFELYRNGTLYRTLTNNRYVDTAASSTSENSYCIIAYDASGNASEASNVVSFIAAKDTSAPIVTGLNYDLDKVSEANSVIKVHCVDDISLSEFIAEIKSINSNDWKIAYRRTVSKTSDTVEFSVIDSVTDSGDYNIRITLKDYAGNVSTYENIFGYVKNELIRPEITAEVFGRTAQLKWTAASETLEVKYYLYRRYRYASDKCVGVTNELSYTISALNPEDTYEYYIVAEDQYGNEVSGYSVSVKPSDDETAPEILSISPKSSTKIGDNTIISISCRDDSALGELVVELVSNGVASEVYSKQLSGITQVVQFQTNMLDLDRGSCTFVFKLIDRAGNKCEPYTITYDYSSCSLSAPILDAKAAGWSVNLNWTMIDTTELAGYYVYRKQSSESKYERIAGITNTSMIDNNVVAGESYDYYVEAVDDRGNIISSESVTVIPTSEDNIPPIAYIREGILGIVGHSVGFDGSASSDNRFIEKYYWDFGDGQSSVGSKTSHIFSEPGVYEVSLTVFDSAGNNNTSTASVQVYDQDYCAINFTIHDIDGNPLPSAKLYWVIDGIEYSAETDIDGNYWLVSKTSEAVDIYFYKNGYLPTMKSCSISTGTSSYAILLEKSEIVTGKVTATQLDLAEIELRGIDIHAPENQFVFDYTVEVQYRGKDYPINFTTNGHGELLGEIKNNIVVETDGQKQFIEFKPVIVSNNTIGNNSLSTNPNAADRPIIALFSVTVNYSWLKEFFDIQLTIINNADDIYPIENAYATLSLPEGLSLASVSPAFSNDLVAQIGTVNGGETQNASWTVRGDKTGDYEISAEFNGILRPFGEPINVIFKTSEPLHVSGGTALKLEVVSDFSDSGEFRFAEYTLTNISNAPVYNLKASISTFAEFSAAKEMLLEYSNGSYEIIGWNNGVPDFGNSKKYFNALIYNDFVEILSLDPNESLTIIARFDDMV